MAKTWSRLEHGLSGAIPRVQAFHLLSAYILPVRYVVGGRTLDGLHDGALKELEQQFA
jgi:hypothetical protein